MPLRVERSPRGLAGRAILVSLVVLAAMPLYLSLDAAWRPLIVRLACGALVAVACTRVMRALGRAVERDTVSPLDAPPPAVPEPELDSRFVRLRDEVVFSTRSRRYFDAILWPRLVGLAGSDLPRPAERRGLRRRRGPTLAVLEDLIARIERRT
jgi:hypothetical protein